MTEATEGDVFYTPPSPLPGVHGDVIWSRPLDGVAALKSAAHNELVLYRSDAVDGTPIAVSGIVALPQVPAPDGGYPLISWAHGTLGLGDKCAPSRDSQDMAESLWDHHLINQAPHVLLNAFLEAGWAVAMSDFEGMGTPGRHPFLLGQSEAHGVLDIALAARRLYPQISNRLAIVGHSQGGQGALFAAHYARPGAGPRPARRRRARAGLTHQGRRPRRQRLPRHHRGFGVHPAVAHRCDRRIGRWGDCCCHGAGKRRYVW